MAKAKSNVANYKPKIKKERVKRNFFLLNQKKINKIMYLKKKADIF